MIETTGEGKSAVATPDGNIFKRTVKVFYLFIFHTNIRNTFYKHYMILFTLRQFTAAIVQELYDFSRNKLQQKVFQRFLVNRGVFYDIIKV